MKKLLVIILVALPLMAASAHKYYFSVTQVDYDVQSKSLKIVTRVFYDDLEKVFQERYDKSIKVDETYDQEKLDAYIQKYFNSKFIVSINGKEQKLSYIGHKDEVDYVVCFVQVKNITNPQSIEIENTLLMDMFPDQKNVIHLQVGNTKKSYLLNKENDKAMLKLSK